MLMRKFAATSALLIAALGVSAGTVNAAPAADQKVINYTATGTDTQSILSIDQGSIEVEDGALKIKDAAGTTVAGTPLAMRIDDFEFPIGAEISGRTATLTPQVDMSHATYKPVALPYEDKAPWKTEYDREQAAFNRMKDTIAMGATIGTLVGGLGGAAIGCVLGGATGAVLTGAISVLLGAPAGFVGGCIAGFLAIGALGTLLGQIFVTAPVAIGAVIQYFTTINQPFVAPK
ncbi:hypothetical protein ACQPW1_01340 [Nocardia sp. CA-128927]|uniref:hypothetical protein n=1 Tax=Nocardia sp. CA-128927 TaxID=3239975 RepID=UPI003D954A51